MSKSFFQNIIKRSNNTYKYYKSIDYLPLFNFFMIHKNEDLRYLLKLEDYEILPENVDLEPLQKAWEKILLEYTEAENSNAAVIQFTTNKKLLKLELEYLMIWNMYNVMTTIPDSQEVKDLKKEAGLEDKDLKWFEKRIKVLSNQIRIKRKDIKEKNPKEKDVDFYQIIDQIESIKGYTIDIYKTTVRKYIAIKKNIKAQAKNGRQNNAKRRN